MTRIFATQKDICEALVARLRLKISFYNDANCFVSDQPTPVIFPSGKEGCTVAPGPGQFDDIKFSGAGMATLGENATAIVTCFVRHKRDRPGRGEQKLLSQADGMLVRKQLIIGALFAHHWEPVHPVTGDQLLTSQLSPQSVTAPGDVTIGKDELVAFGLTVATPFDWLVQDPDGDDCAYLEGKPCL